MKLFCAKYLSKFLQYPRLKTQVYKFSTCSLTSQNVRVRFAPSPTGFLHLGGLRTALYNYLFAKSRNGKFLLRVEDTDQIRFVPGATEKLIDILNWAGIQIDEGPSIGGNRGPYIQSERIDLYHHYVNKLIKSGSAYHCFCSPKRLDLLRKEATRRGQTPGYDNKCRNLSRDEIERRKYNSEKFVIRFKVPDEMKPWNDEIFGLMKHNIKDEGDPVIVKADGFPTYHLANVVDDHLMEITHVLRGVEWQISTPKHIAMFEAFGWTPPHYAHLPLILNKDQTKMSKRQDDVHVEYYKERGYLSDTLIGLLTTGGGGFNTKNPEFMTINELTNKFDMKLIHKKSSRLQMDRLDEIQRFHFGQKLIDVKARETIVSEVRQIITAHFKNSSDLSNINSVELSDKYIGKILDWAKERITNINSLVSSEFLFLWSLPPTIPVDLSSQAAKKAIKDTLESISKLEDNKELDTVTLVKVLKTTSKLNNLKYPQYMKLLRSSLTGLKEGPSIAEVILILGIDQTKSRLEYALEAIER
ncbi:DgyrCDS7423 [Dimorphilus gyrociliatus]|uniref:Nondiscriminating glutamyl-tRNA synthetase EARS2, mitochondrial n=1 Tax=Dimorphilus gyrociliatus TaxID=2664684 RepID=A0A7I8VSQ6_9ANNE|nr:DgyrCDS7423 [Dimorphilus gyrociliatus]